MSSAVTRNALWYIPIVDPFDSDGNILPFPNPSENLITSPLLQYAPGQYINEERSYRFFYNVYGEYQFARFLSYRLNVGTDLASFRLGTFNGDLTGNPSNGSVSNGVNFAYTIENILNFDKAFGSHYLNILGMFSTQEERTERSSLRGQDIPINRSTFYDLGSAANITGISSSLSEWGLLSYLGRINYRFKERYLLTLSGRADGSSRLAEGNKWAFFPAASAAWIISEEDFFDIVPVSFLKFRASYGEVGNTSINPFQTQGGLVRSVYAFGNIGAFGFSQATIPNPDLKWEISRTFNFGLDFAVFNERISGTLEIYNTRTRDLILSRQLPVTSGYEEILENIGSTQNNGWELSLQSKIVSSKGSGFNWDVDLNVFSNNEEIVELFSGTQDDIGNRWFIGQPIDVFYDHQFDGIWQLDQQTEAAQWGQQPGDIRIKDVNGRGDDGELTNQPDGILNNDDRTILGSTVPDWSGGINNRFSFKGLDLSILVYARQGQLLQSGFHSLDFWNGRVSSIRHNYWTPSNPSNEIPVPRVQAPSQYRSSVSYFNGSFVKIKNISLGFSLPRRWLDQLGINKLRFYATATNPLIFSEYDFLDPETANGFVPASTFSTSTYIFGINLNF